jgi:eukaryotic-like serine/threonine-protein kinase
MNPTFPCAACGLEFVPQGALRGLCPKCLLTGVVTDAAADVDRNFGAAPPAPRFVPPKTADLQPFFDQLEILELIGHGGMSAVYKARQKSIDRIVAIKILPQEVAEAAGGTERFERETKTLARLSHPNVVGLFDAGQVGPWCYCITAWLNVKGRRS